MVVVEWWWGVDEIMKRWFLKGEVCLSFIWFHLPMLSRIVRGGAYGGVGG